MKKSLLLFSLATVAAGAASAQSYLQENFNATVGGALPASWSSVPASLWTTGAPDVVSPYFLTVEGSINNPVHMMACGINGNSTSADGAILATPAINLPASATGAVVAFSKYFEGYYKSNDNTKKESFKLVASVNGGSWTDVATINPRGGWSDTAINIGSLAGQNNVKIGFKYGNTATALVGAVVDNVRILIQSSTDIAITAAAPAVGDAAGYKAVGSQASITGSVYNYGSTTLSSYTVKYQQGANAPVSYTVSGANIAPLSSGNFTHSVPYTVPSVGTFPIKVWVELTGDAYHNDDTAAAQVIGVSFMPVKRLVFEEGTGTWCGWCPRGAVFMEKFAETTPGKVAQIAVHNGDPMTIAAYDNYMVAYNGGGFPNMVVDRSTETDPSNINTAYDAMKDNFGFAELTMGTPTVAGTTVSVPVTVKPATNLTNAKLALVVTESNVTGSGTDWPQHNYYAGGGSGPMDGWETQGSTVSNVNFHFVARAISPSPGGDASGLPASLTAGTNYNATLTATLNSSWKTADLQYIVMLIDGSNTHIMNSVFSELPHLKPGLPTAISNIEAGINLAKLYPNPASNIAYLSVDLKEASKATLTITDAVGRSVAAPQTTTMRAGENVMEIPTAQLSNGMYMISLDTEKGRVSMKLQVVK